jgi:cytochrome b561
MSMDRRAALTDKAVKGESMNAEANPTVVAATRIAAGDDRTRYDEFAITLHWVTVVLVLMQFGLAETWHYASRPIKHVMIVGHMSFGILLAAVVVTRIVWRFLPGHWVRPAVSGFVELLSKAVHYLLYALLCIQATLGFALRWSGHEAMSFFGLQIPPPFGPTSKPVHHLIGEAHNYVGWTIIIVAAGHAAAALFHHFFLRDDVLWRMIPGRRAKQREIQAPSSEAAQR